VGGKSKAVTVGYKHYLGMHLIACHGPIDFFSRIRFDERSAWEGAASGGQIEMSATELFGGEEREGGVSGTVDIEMGYPDQGRNDYLVSQIGPDIPGYRGVAGMVFRDCYLGNNPYIKPASLRGQRINVRQDGIPQWYPEKAEISLDPPPGVEPTVYSMSEAFPTLNRFESPSFPGNNTFYPGSSVTIGPFPYRARICGGVGSPGIGICIADDNFVIDGAIWPGNSSSMFGFETTFAVLDPGETMLVRVWNVGGNLTGAGGNMAAVPIGTPTGDMNPAHIIRECLTDPDWGMGYLDEDIDDESFMAAADQLFDEGMGISLLWDRQAQIEDFVAEIVRHIDAALFVSRTTGKFILRLTRQGPTPTLLLDESNIDKIESPNRAAFGELINSVTIQFWNAETGKDDSVTLQDPAGVQMQGAVINTTLQYPGFTNLKIASIVGARDLRALSNPYLTCTIYCGEDGADLEIGDTFLLTWAKWRLFNVPMRVTSFALGDGKRNQVRITCVEDVFSTPLNAIIAPPSAGWVDPSRPPDPASYQAAFEVPYFELVQAQGQATTDSELAASPEIGYVAAAAVRGNASAIAARLWTDDGAGYEEAGAMDLCPGGALSANISPLSTTISLTGVADLDLVETGTHAQIGDELVRIDAIDAGAGTATIGRGVLDTVPVPHLAGTPVLFWDAYNGVDLTEYASGEEIDVKVTPTSGSGKVALSEATEMTVALNQRAFRPYAPGNLTINGESYAPGAAYDSNELAIAWAHRDRTQQTSGELADHFDGDIGPEAGTTYRVRVYQGGALDPSLEQDEIDGTSASVTPTISGPVTIEVHSKRDGVYSWQGARHSFVYIAAGAARLTEEGDFMQTEDGDTRVTED
tara:strand:- start:1002 stop:3599 length:2598 start_codon:yes stop_codon:yes gene_type:complete